MKVNNYLMRHVKSVSCEEQRKEKGHYLVSKTIFHKLKINARYEVGRKNIQKNCLSGEQSSRKCKVMPNTSSMNLLNT